MAGLTNTGLTILRLPDVLDANKARAQDIFSDLVEPGDTVDVDNDNSTIARLIGVVAPAEASIWEALQQIHNSFNPATATGYALDNIVSLSGIARLPAQATSAQVLFTGTVGTLITTSAKVQAPNTQRLFSVKSSTALDANQASGVQVEVIVAENSTAYVLNYSVDNTGFIAITYTSDASATDTEIVTGLKAQIDSTTGGIFVTSIDIDGVLHVSCSDPFQPLYFTTSANLNIGKVSKLGVVVGDTLGPLGQAAHTINTISVPVVGWDSVDNPLPATTGRYEESDEELRERFSNSKFVQAANIIEALLDALRNVDGVTDVMVYENDTDVTDLLGIPAHSFMPIVLGGLNTTIAETIWQNKPTGILSFGNTSVTVLDSQNLQHVIKFKRPASIPIYISISVTNTGGMPGDVAAQIKQAVKAYGDETYFIGDDVVYSRFYTPVNSIQGFAVNSLTIGTAPSPTGTTNLTIDFDEVATFDLDKIVVTVV